MILTLLALQATSVAAAVADPGARCRALARTDAVAAERLAGQFPLSTSADGLVCRGDALARQDRWAEAARAYTDAARRAEVAKGDAARLWVQAGNGWLAAGDMAQAKAALDAGLAAGTLDDLQRGEAHLDRARALVAAGELPAARTDIDQALVAAGEDPLAWLLSATLARRMNEPARAATDIAEALRRSPDDASVQLERGNIAAAAGDAAAAQTAWREAARLAPDAPAGRSAINALAQFASQETK